MDDYLTTLLGERARRVPAWFYTRYHGDGVVSFAGASKFSDPHPLRYGSERDVQFHNGEIIVRSAVVIGTDVFHGFTMGQLMCNYHDIEHMLSDGEMVLDKP